MRTTLLLALSLALLACSTDEADKPADRPKLTELEIVGSWSGVGPMGKKMALTYEIVAGGQLSLTTRVGGVGMPIENKGSWRLDEDGHQIKLTAAGQWDQGWIDVELRDGKLVLGGKYEFTRQP